MKRLIVSSLISLVLLTLLTSALYAQGDTPKPIVDTLSVQIDGVTRTLTITFVPTGVLSAEVAPIPLSDTFAVTATAWLADLFNTLGNIQPNDSVAVDEINTRLDELFDLTETVPYPSWYTPFVRQYRFAIHTCREWVAFHSNVTKDEQNAIFAIGPYVTLQSACKNRYQEAYVEMERIKQAAPTVKTVAPSQSTVAILSDLPVDNLGIPFWIEEKSDSRLSFVDIQNLKKKDGTLEFLLTLKKEPTTEIDNAGVTIWFRDARSKDVGSWNSFGDRLGDTFYFNIDTEISVKDISSYVIQWQAMPEE